MFLLRAILSPASTGKLSVFLFHKVPPIIDPLIPSELDLTRFGQILEFVHEHFHVLPLSEAVKLLASGKLPSRSAAITFDDGYVEWVDGAAKMLASRNMPATFFITTGQFSGHRMWHERLANLVRAHDKPLLNTEMVRLPSIITKNDSDKAAAIQRLEYHFKYLPIVVRERFLKELEDTVGVDAENLPVFTSEHLLSIANMGFEIGAHTVEHPILGLCNSEHAFREIGEAKEILEGIIGRRVLGFAYPNGRPGVDFTHKHIEMVKASGYEYAVTTQWGVGRNMTSPFQIPRFTPWGPSSPQMFLQMLRNMYIRPESIQEVT